MYRALEVSIDDVVTSRQNVTPCRLLDSHIPLDYMCSKPKLQKINRISGSVSRRLILLTLLIWRSWPSLLTLVKKLTDTQVERSAVTLSAMPSSKSKNPKGRHSKQHTFNFSHCTGGVVLNYLLTSNESLAY